MRFFSGIGFLGLLLALTMGNLSADAEPLWMVDPPSEIFSGHVNMDISGMAEVGGMLYFTAKTRHNGRELWRSDGTGENTVLVGDLAPSDADLDVQEMIAFQDNLYIVFASEGYGSELWRIGGTSPQATLVKDINPGNADARPSCLTVFDDMLVFTANDGVHGNQLWKSDGTEAGTSMLCDFHTNERYLPSADYYHYKPYPILKVIGNSLYFLTVDNGGDNWEIWCSDGTAGGMRRTFSSRGNSFSPCYCAADRDGNILVLMDGYSNNMYGLWKSDGVAENTVEVTKINLGDLSTSDLLWYGYIESVNGILYFSGYDEEHGAELWRTDGTASGTFMIKDIYPGEDGSYIRCITACGDKVFFLARDEEHGFELWVSDGTSEGTKLVKDITEGLGTCWYGSHAKFIDPLFTAIGDTIFFRAAQTDTGFELWKSDGTAEGTFPVRDICPGECSAYPSSFTPVQDRLFFLATDEAYADDALWVSDGTFSGTHEVEFPAQFYCDTRRMYERRTAFLNDTLYWSYGELYRVDLLQNHIDLVKDLRPEGTSGPDYLQTIGEKIFFRAYLPETGYELFVSDGTPEGTKLVKDILPGSEDGIAIAHKESYQFWQLGGMAIFTADDGTGAGLWRSDGTEEGTVLVKSGISKIRNAVEVDGTLLFVGVEGPSWMLFCTDGTEAGTKVVTQLSNGEGKLFAMGDLVLFSMRFDYTIGFELYKTDGTKEGTVLLKDVASGNSDSTPRDFTLVNGKTFFVANIGGGGTAYIPNDYELWCTDGTPAGTVLVKDICPGSKSSEPELLTAVNDKLLFTADDGIHGRELWCSDGTEEGTVMVKDITGNALSASPTGLTYATDGEKHCVVFAAWEAEHGRELWISDLTESGTHLLRDICPGILNSMPQEFQSSENYIYLTADDGVYGFQIWALDVKQMMQESEGEEEGEVVSEGEVEGAVEGEVVPEGELEGAVEGEVSPEGEVEGAVEGEVISEGEMEGAVEGEVSPEGEVEGVVEGEVVPEGEVEGAVEGEEGSEEQPYPMCGCLNTETTQKAMEYLFGDFLLLLVSGVLLQFFARYRKF